MYETTNLRTPVSKETIRSLKTGDAVIIEGNIYVLRDEAEKRIYQYLRANKKTPMKLEGAILFHSGPIVRQIGEKWVVVALGPTTTSRINSIAPGIMERSGIRGIIGKGGLDKVSLKAMGTYGCVYIAFPGGAAAFGSSAVSRVGKRIWGDLIEPVWIIEVSKLGPLVVAMDTNGNSLYKRE